HAADRHHVCRHRVRHGEPQGQVRRRARPRADLPRAPRLPRRPRTSGARGEGHPQGILLKGKGHMSPIEVLGIDHVDLTVNDLEPSIAFYEKLSAALGFRRLATDDYIAWGNAHMNVAVRPRAEEEKSATFNRYRVGLHHIAFRTRSREEVDRFHRFLVDEGITV